MATFRIHEEQENETRPRKEEMFPGHRRAFADLSHFARNQNCTKPTGLTNGPVKVQEENRILRHINNEKKINIEKNTNNDKNIVLPVAQFRAFSVYEDNPTEVAPKKCEPTFKPFGAREVKEKFSTTVENSNNKIQTYVQRVQLETTKEVTTRVPLQEKQDDVPSESDMSIVLDSAVKYNMSCLNSAAEIDDDEEDDDVVTAQTDRELFFHVVQYRQDIYEYMLNIEIKHKANPRYMRKQPDISYNMRSILVDWLAEVCEEYNQQSETLHLAVSYVDRFLSYMSVIRGKLQLVGTAATYIAAKYEEVYPPEVSDFVYITDDTYTKREVLRMEHLMLKVLSFDLSTPTSLAFLSHYCIASATSKKTFHLASYIAELSLLEADPYLHFKPSVIAAAALATARHCLLCRHCDKETTTDAADDQGCPVECSAIAWPSRLARCSGYELADIALCARQLARTHSHASIQPHQAIPDKYRHNKFDSVTTIEPHPMYPVSKYEPPAPTANKTDSRPDTRPAAEPVAS